MQNEIVYAFDSTLDFNKPQTRQAQNRHQYEDLQIKKQYPITREVSFEVCSDITISAVQVLH